MNLLIGGGGVGRGRKTTGSLRVTRLEARAGLDWNGWPLKQREKGGAQQPNGSTDATPTVSYF
jgi:hypothetical protein